jgi:hypothetical protein
MSEMVERVARAIRREKDRCRSVEEQARAAIEAMREQTEEMLDAAWNTTLSAEVIWRTMIEAALAES